MLAEVKKGLVQLKLAGIAKSIEDKIDYATEAKLSFLEFIKILLETEFSSRKNNSLRKRANKSKLPQTKKIEDYDFKFQPSLNKLQILNLSSCDFIEKKENIILMGKPGTGKTHLACAIGLKALFKGYKVLFTTAHELIKELHQSKADGTYYMKLSSYVKPDLLIIDEIGFKKFTQHGVDDLFEIINQRYENKPIIITSNKPFEDWSNILFDPVLASAITDRLVHHSQVISIKGESYRAKIYKESNKEKK
jgi:DNA replication protein DnaC